MKCIFFSKNNTKIIHNLSSRNKNFLLQINNKYYSHISFFRNNLSQRTSNNRIKLIFNVIFSILINFDISRVSFIQDYFDVIDNFILITF